jgi:hypothetical protein
MRFPAERVRRRARIETRSIRVLRVRLLTAWAASTFDACRGIGPRCGPSRHGTSPAEGEARRGLRRILRIELRTNGNGGSARTPLARNQR